MPVSSELIAFLEGLPDPHIVFDKRYRIVAANAAYRKQFAPNHDVIGRTCYQVSHGYDAPCDQSGESCPLALARESGQRERVLHLHHTPRGEAFVNIELSPLPGPRGQAAYFVEKMESVQGAHGLVAAPGLVGRARSFQRMLELVARVAPSDAAVLLQGESGTGKELVARAVHEASARAQRPLVVVDCTAIPESLFESELFGHERGAFTGATAAKPGLVEAADGGTLFLDEVGDIPLSMQVKLLRFLESGTYRRVGATDLRRADVRLVSATHRDLQAMVADGRFRQDLYFRISTFPIHLPSLRDRPQDIPPLVEALLKRVAPQRALKVSDAALVELKAQAFPGNVRELRNLLERAAVLCDGDTLQPRHFRVDGSGPGQLKASPRAGNAPSREGGGESLKDLADSALRARVQTHRGTRQELAAALGISERTLFRKLRALRLKS